MVKRAAGASAVRKRLSAKASRQLSKSKRAPEALAATAPAGGVPVHLRKRVLRKASFLDKVRSSQQAPRAKAGKKNLRRRAVPASLDLSAIRAALEESTAQPDKKAQQSSSSCQGRGGARKRTQVTAQETARLQQVLTHPAYQEDPLAALQQHLGDSLPVAAVPEAAPKQKQPKGRRRGKARQA